MLIIVKTLLKQMVKLAQVNVKVMYITVINVKQISAAVNTTLLQAMTLNVFHRAHC